MRFITYDTSAVDLSNTQLQYANLRDADLRGKTLAGADLMQAELQGANLTGADLNDAILVCANLKNARLVKANLTQVTANNAVFDGARLQDAFLDKGEFINASLKGAFLQGANLERSVLDGADLTDADLTGADLSGASLAGVNLTRAIGLGTREGEIAFAESTLWAINVEEFELDMDYWHRACGTAHCIAGFAFPDEAEPGQKASLLYPTLAQYFYSSKGDAIDALRRVAAGELSVFPD